MYRCLQRLFECKFIAEPSSSTNSVYLLPPNTLKMKENPPKNKTVLLIGQHANNPNFYVQCASPQAKAEFFKVLYSTSIRTFIMLNSQMHTGYLGKI